jgi:hypothetical protein
VIGLGKERIRIGGIYAGLNHQRKRAYFKSCSIFPTFLNKFRPEVVSDFAVAFSAASSRWSVNADRM